MPGEITTPRSFVAGLAFFAGVALIVRGLSVRANLRMQRDGRGASELKAPEGRPSRFQIAAMRPKAMARIQEAAAPYMEPREMVRRAFYGQTGMPTGYAFLGTPLGLVKLVIVVATDRHVYVFQRGLRQSPQIKGLLRKYTLGPSNPVSFRRGAMRIGPDTYWVAALIAQHDAKALVHYVATRDDQTES